MSTQIQIEQLSQQTAGVVRGKVRTEDIPDFIGGAFGEVIEVLSAEGLHPTGPPFARYHIDDGVFTVAAGFPSSGTVVAKGRVEPVTLPGGPVATTTHVGPYSGVAEAYASVQQWLDASGLVCVGDPWESYLDEPDVPEPRTVLCFPCSEATAA